MKATTQSVKNPLESISRRSVLGVMGVGMTGILVGCNDDLSPLSATLSSDMTDLTAAGSIMLTAKLDVGYANSVEFYDGATLIDTVPLLAGQASKTVTLDATKNGKHTFITKITSSTGKQAYSNPVDVMVNIGVSPPPSAPTIALSASSNSVIVGGSTTLTATAAATTGTITKVEFFEGTTLLKSVPAAPFTFTTPAFTSTDNGTHSYKATVTTDASSLNTNTSSAVDVVVNIPVPVVTIALSSSDTALTAAKTITLTAVVTGGTVSSVNFFDGTTALGAGTAGAVAGTFTKDVIIAGNPLTQTHSFTATSTFNAKPVTSNAVTVNLSIALPTIGLTASTTSLTAAGNVVLTATVTGGTVSQIEFFEGATSLGMVSASPYKTTIVFTATSPAQAHSYIARATVIGATTTVDSAPVNVNVNIGNLAPTVSLTSSSNNVTVGGSITLTASASAKTGTISSVEFFDGATSLGIVTAAPFTKTVALTTLNNGTHNYTAKATDSSNNSATSTPAVAVVVNIATLAPTVTLASSSNSVTAAGSVTLTASATPDPAVSISKVEFFEGATLLATKTATPYTHAPTYTNANNGTHNYTAKATDSSGKSTTSSAVTVSVNIAAIPPTIALSANPTSVTAAGSSTLTATVTAGTGTITQVDFYEGTTLLGTKTAAPYTLPIPYTTANNGTHTYTAKVTDSSNSVVTSGNVSVTVNIAATTPPTITLAASPTSVTATGSSTLTATVTAGSGTISKVDFYEGATLLGTKTASPYTYAPAYTSANNGTHTYTAKVTDSNGSVVTSAPATVTVNITATTGTRIALYTALAAAGSYVNFNHPTSGIKCILYRAATAQTGGVSNAGAYYVAYSRKCTHAGTIITQNPNTANPHVLTCQDHGATYNMDSNCAPINGIAPSALPVIAIIAGTDGIYI
jgi:Rieske Fe-S protein